MLPPVTLPTVRSMVLAIGFALGVVACTAEPTPAHRADTINAHTMSPFCPGRTLTSCPSPSAAEWRQDIRKWVDQGVSTPEIRRRLEARAPLVNLSGAPESPLGWGLPVVLTVLSVALLGVILVRLRSARTRAQAEQAESSAVASEGESRRINEQLDRELEALSPDRD